MYTINKDTLDNIKALWENGSWGEAADAALAAGFQINDGWGCDCPGGDNAIIIETISDESGRDNTRYIWLEPRISEVKGMELELLEAFNRAEEND